MSRICVKNLPKHVDDKKLRELFSEKGEVTDAKLMRTSEGKSRQFAFIGFRSEVQAQEAIQYFNRTFIDTYRISCELARKVGDPDIPRPWSRHSKEKEKEKEKKEKIESEARDGGAAAAKSRGRRGEGEGEEEINDPKLKEFLQVMQPSAKSKLWSNDTVIGNVDEKIRNGEKNREQKKKKKKENDDTSAPMELEEEEEDVVNNVAKDNEVSDMDYFKSRVKKGWSESESSDDDDDNDDEEEEEEEEKKSDEVEAKEEDEVDEEEAGDEDELAKSNPPSNLEDKKGEMLDTSRLFVRNLPFTATEDELEEHFSKFGDAQVHLVIDKEMNRSKGIAYVLYSQPEAAQRYSFVPEVA